MFILSSLRKYERKGGVPATVRQGISEPVATVVEA